MEPSGQAPSCASSIAYALVPLLIPRRLFPWFFLKKKVAKKAYSEACARA